MLFRSNKKLFTTGDTSQLEVMRAQRQVTELQGRINSVRNKYLQDARAEAAKIAEELSTNYYRLEERQSVLDHTTITAPVAGIVKYQRMTTIGGVLRQGDELMQISPTETEPVFEVNINPNPVDQILNVSIEVLTSGQASIRIINSLGQLIVSESMPLNKGLNTWNFNKAAALPKGIYQFQLFTQDGMKATKSFLKK